MRTALAALFTACATFAPPPQSPQPAQEKPATSEAQLVRPKIEALVGHAADVLRARDAAVWELWLGGTPASLDAAWAGHEVLLSDEALASVRRAHELKAFDPALLDALEALVVGERASRAAHDAQSAVASLEASLTFTFEKRDVPWRELNGLLAAEKLAPRRASLWQASLPAAQRLDAALARRDEATAAALQAMGTSPEAFGALLRGADLDAAGQWADRFLSLTDARWKARLTASRATSRADLPAMLKAPAELDAAFPKAKLADRGTRLLAGLSLYGLEGMTLDLNDSPRKQPLPLTVVSSGVRLTFKPRGGWKDQASLLAELGRALALWHTPKAPLPQRRQVVEATAALFSALASDRGWLEEQGLSPALCATAEAVWADQRLFALRRSAGALLAQLTPGDGGPQQLDRALGFTDDPARSRIEAEPLYAAIEPLRAHAQAEALRRHLEAEAGPRWWASPKAKEILIEVWQTNALPERVRKFGATGESLLAALGTPQSGGTSVELGAHPPTESHGAPSKPDSKP